MFFADYCTFLHGCATKYFDIRHIEMIDNVVKCYRNESWITGQKDNFLVDFCSHFWVNMCAPNLCMCIASVC